MPRVMALVRSLEAKTRQVAVDHARRRGPDGADVDVSAAVRRRHGAGRSRSRGAGLAAGPAAVGASASACVGRPRGRSRMTRRRRRIRLTKPESPPSWPSAWILVRHDLGLDRDAGCCCDGAPAPSRRCGRSGRGVSRIAAATWWRSLRGSRSIAARNDVSLQSCRVDGSDVVVEVSRRAVVAVLDPAGSSSAHARAGPRR